MKTELSHIGVITPNYPDSRFVERGAFVERLVRIWENSGVTVDVTAPRSVSNLVRSGLKKRQEHFRVAGNNVVYPTYFSCSNRRLGPVDLLDITCFLFNRAAIRGVKRLPLPDLFYGQFLMTGGLAALYAGREYERPAFADVGESMLIEKMSKKERDKASRIVTGLAGLVCVSRKLADEVVELGADPERVLFAPNTVDLARFYPRDRAESREQLGIPKDIRIVVFVGHFIERKGPMRVLNALEQLSGKVKGVFIGRGTQLPEGSNVLHAGPVPNSEVPVWLSASDIFVLPTLHEGHCNAVNEAMACGLPVISSDIPEIKVQVPPGTGLLVNPDSVDGISHAMDTLFSDPDLMKNMGENAYEVQREKSSRNREMLIFEWLESKVHHPGPEQATQLINP